MAKIDKKNKNGAVAVQDNKSKAPAAKNKETQNAVSEEQYQEIEKRTQMVLAIGGFAAFGLLVGFLWGANHMVPTVHFENALSQASKVACMVAVNTADLGRGMITGIIGTAIGGAFGLSLFMSRRTAKC